MTAKEMFIDLNFKQYSNERVIEYIDIFNTDFHITFYLIEKVISGNQTYDYVCDIKMLQAINKQVEELGWNNEKTNL